MKPVLHGDVGLIPTDKLPEGLKKIDSKDRFVLRHGESGHRHVIVADRPQDIEIYLDTVTGMHVLYVKRPVRIEHEEHKTLVIEPGIFIEKAEREYNPFEKQMQQVVD